MNRDCPVRAIGRHLSGDSWFRHAALGTKSSHARRRAAASVSEALTIRTASDPSPCLRLGRCRQPHETGDPMTTQTPQTRTEVPRSPEAPSYDRQPAVDRRPTATRRTFTETKNGFKTSGST